MIMWPNFMLQARGIFLEIRCIMNAVMRKYRNLLYPETARLAPEKQLR